MQNNRDDFSAKTKELLARRVGYRCSNPYCRKLTCGAGDAAEAYVNIGVAAHICAAAPGGKRYDADMTRETRRNIQNGIWLCQSCAKLIDSNELRYTVEVLRYWKKQAEKATIRELEYRQDRQKENASAHRERLLGIAGDLRKCKDFDEEMACLLRIDEEMGALVQKLELIQEKVDLARSIGDSRWEQIYETQFGNTLSLFEILSHESREKHQQAYYLRNHAESLMQNAPGGELPVRIVTDVSASMNSIHCAPAVDRGIVARAEELLQWLHDSWRRVAALEMELDQMLLERHQYELMMLELL